MQVDHPQSHPLTAAEEAVLATFRQRLHERVVSVGLTSDDVRHIVEAMRGHPEASSEAIRMLMEEARSLMPGGRLMTFDWD